MMTTYVIFIFVLMFITKGLESLIYQGYIPQSEAFRIFIQDDCPLRNSYNSLTTISEFSAKCSITVDYMKRQSRSSYHEKNLVFHSGGLTYSTRRKMKTCTPAERQRIFHFTCTISKLGFIGEVCISKKNCVINTVCNINSFYGSCTCQDGFKEDNGHCIESNVPLMGTCVKNESCGQQNAYCFQSKCVCLPGYSNFDGYCTIEKVKLGEQCYHKEQCGQSYADCYNQKCSCLERYIEVDDNCVEGNKIVGSICQYHQQCTATRNAGVCQGRSPYLECSCNSGFVKINGSCIENLKLGENCTSSNQCRQLNAECRKTQCSCKRGYLQIENHCVEENKTLGSQCQYHEQCTGTSNAGLCLGNSSYLQCSCNVGFLEMNRLCIEMQDFFIPKRDKTFFDTKVFVAILSGIISVILGVSLAVLVFVYTKKSRSLRNGQNSKYSHQHQNKKDLKCSTADYHDSQDGIEMGCEINDKRDSDSVNEVAHQESDKNHSNLDHDPYLYNHLNEKDELESVRGNDYSTAQKESQNDAGEVYAQVQSRTSKQSKRFIVEDVYMPVNEENKF